MFYLKTPKSNVNKVWTVARTTRIRPKEIHLVGKRRLGALQEVQHGALRARRKMLSDEQKNAETFAMWPSPLTTTWWRHRNPSW